MSQKVKQYAASRFYANRAGGNQATPSGATTLLQLNFEQYDSIGEFDAAATYFFQPTHAGYYLLTGNVNLVSPGAAGHVELLLITGGRNVRQHRTAVAADIFIDLNVTVVWYLTPADTVGMYVGNAGLVGLVATTGADYTYLCGHRLS